MLCGCSSGISGDAFAARIAEHYSSQERLTLTMSATFDHGETFDTYALRHVYDANDGHIIEVLAPADLAGLRTYITAEGSAISYDGMIFHPGALPGTYASPISVLPELLRCWSAEIPGAYYDEDCTGKTCRMLEYQTHIESELWTVRTWFDRETYGATQSEVYVGGVRVITITYD